MFIGHMAVGFASKRVAPRTSLGLLMAAPMALDLLWPLFLLAGWEQVSIDPGNTAFTPLDFVSYPYSHSLAMSALLGALFGLFYWAGRICRYTPTEPRVLAWDCGILWRVPPVWNVSCLRPACGCTRR